MRYISTRGGVPPVTFFDASMQGVAQDGGLYVAASYPTLDVESLRGKSYAEIAQHVFRLYGGEELVQSELETLCRCYDPAKFGGEVAPVKRLAKGVFLLDLSTGQTGAFKDYGMAWLGVLYPHILKKRGMVLVIVGSTSGDTGAAAEYALRGHDNVIMVMLYPATGMSDVQQMMMNTLPDKTIINLAIRARFDTCQTFMKRLTLDPDLRARYQVGNVNSTALPRPLAQVVYYIASYLKVAKPKEFVSYSVPTGNFGDIYAGYVAKQMGLPIKRLYLATNENNVLAELWATGIYRVRNDDEVIVTSSNSMDITGASNLERVIFDITGRDAARTRQLYANLAGARSFDLREGGLWEKLKQTGIVAGTSGTNVRHRMIGQVWRLTGQLVEPHTADGLVVAQMLHQTSEKVICLQTAAPWKFPAVLKETTGQDVPLPAAYRDLATSPKREIVLDADYAAVKMEILGRLEGLFATR